MRTKSLKTFVLTVANGLAACGTMEVGPGEDGSSGSAGSGGSGSGASGAAGAPPSGGTTGVGGSVTTGGSPSGGGTTATGGAPTGGSAPTGGLGGTGNSATGGIGGIATGGSAGGGRGGNAGTAGGGRGGSGGVGGAGGSGGTAAGGTGGTSDACSMTTPLTGGTTRQSSNASGTAAGMAWTIWSNGSGGSITYYDKPAFRANWNNSGDFLARLGLQWNATRTYDTYGTITAQYASSKTGTAGGYSYVGIYGWSVSPCVEYYIVDDSYNRMPVNPGNTTNKGTASIDGGTYTLYTRNTTGTGGSKCPGTSSWAQYYSIRQTARTCGQISITEHFDAWAAAGMPLGRMDQAQILIEAGGGVGSIDFTYAIVTATMP